MVSFLGLLLLIGVTIYLAFVYQNATILLLAYIQAAVFVVSFFALLIQRFMLKVRIEVPVGISEKGRESMVKLVITNRGPFRIHKTKVQVVVNDILRRKKQYYWMKLPLIPRGESEFIKMISFYGTGNYEIRLKRLRIYDISGLLWTTLHIKHQGTVQVMPEIHDVPVKMTLATKNFYGESDVYDEHSPGHDTSELFQVREYREGDRIQNVHWKLTAKQDELMVKEHSLPKACPVILFLEYHPEKRQQLLPFMEAVASLSFSIMDAGCPHYIAWYDSMEMDVQRIRVDDEESLFYFIGELMKIKWVKHDEDLKQRYRDRFRMEPYVWAFSLDEKLRLYKEKEFLTKYSAKQMEKSLAQVELLL